MTSTIRRDEKNKKQKKLFKIVRTTLKYDRVLLNEQIYQKMLSKTTFFTEKKTIFGTKFLKNVGLLFKQYVETLLAFFFTKQNLFNQILNKPRYYKYRGSCFFPLHIKNSKPLFFFSKALEKKEL